MTQRPLRGLVAAIALALALGLSSVLASRAAEAVEIQRVVSPGGVEAWLVEDHSVPIIALRAAFRGGAALDPAGKEGLADFVSKTLDEGAGDLDSQAFQAKLEDLVITLRFDAGLDNFSVNLRTLTENRDTALELLRLALTAPRFDDEPVERVRRAILSGLARDSEDPDYLARRHWWRATFPDHPYGRPVRGVIDTVKGIAREDLRAFVRQRLGRDNLVLGVVGDISAAELGPILDRTFAGLPAAATPAAVGDAAPDLPGGVTVIEKDVPQSVVAFGQQGLKRADPDWYAAYALNYILGGGGFTSRLYQEIRERRGLAYSVYSYLTPMDHAGLLVGGVGTENGRVRESIELIRQEIRRIRDDGPSAEELENAKTFLTGSFFLRFDRTDRIANILVAIQLDDLGIDYLDRRNALIEAVTMADIRRVAKRLLDPDRITFVVVGRPDGLDQAPRVEVEG